MSRLSRPRGEPISKADLNIIIAEMEDVDRRAVEAWEDLERAESVVVLHATRAARLRTALAALQDDGGVFVRLGD